VRRKYVLGLDVDCFDVRDEGGRVVLVLLCPVGADERCWCWSLQASRESGLTVIPTSTPGSVRSQGFQPWWRQARMGW